MMRIAHVIDTIISGGAEAMAVELCIDLSQRGHRVDLIVLNSLIDDPFEKGVLERLNVNNVGIVTAGRVRGRNMNFPAVVMRLRSIQNTRKYDRIHSHSHVCHFFIGLLKKTCRSPFKHVITVHNSQERWYPPTCLLCRNAAIVFCSSAAAGGKAASRNGTIINNGIKKNCSCSLEPEERTALKRNLEIEETDKIIISVGNLRRQKNYEFAFKTIRHLVESDPDNRYRYLVCGNGPEMDTLKDLVDELALTDTVMLLGTRSDVRTLLELSDCFLSVSTHEGLPLAVLEAFSAGIGCVLSPIDEHRAIAEDVQGCRMPETMDPFLFAAEIMMMINSGIKKDTMKTSRQDALNRFSWEHCLMQYEQLYLQLAD